MAPNCDTFFTKKTSKKGDNLGTFTEMNYFWTIIEQKGKQVWHDNLDMTIWGHGLYTFQSSVGKR